MWKKETNEGLTRSDLIYLEEMRVPEHGMYFDLEKDSAWYFAVSSWGTIIHKKD